MDKIVVTGIGIISAIGNNAAQNHISLREGKCGISNLQMFPSRFCGSLPVGEIKINTEALKETLNAFESGISRTTLLALHAMREAIDDSGLSKEQISSIDTALIGASTVGGMCLTDEMYLDSKKDSPGSAFLSSYDCSATNMYLQKKYSINGPINTINTACSSSANAIMFGIRLIKSGRVKRAIVGGFESLAKFTINGFNALHILSPDLCTPFDEDRKGLNLGEGAAFLILEKEKDVPGKKIYASLTGYANTNDAFHASSLSEDGIGPYKAMEAALKSAYLHSSDIDFINAHGTGTENNDRIESIAMLRLFENVPRFSSTKSNTGHTLGAASAIEALYCVLSLAHQELFPALNFNNSITGLGLEPFQIYQKTSLKNIMSNSFGFGGNCSSLIFSKV